jgi:hypothetical protein
MGEAIDITDFLSELRLEEIERRGKRKGKIWRDVPGVASHVMVKSIIGKSRPKIWLFSCRGPKWDFMASCKDSKTCVTVLLGALVGHAAPHPREIQDDSDANETEHNKMRIFYR